MLFLRYLVDHRCLLQSKLPVQDNTGCISREWLACFGRSVTLSPLDLIVALPVDKDHEGMSIHSRSFLMSDYGFRCDSRSFGDSFQKRGC